MGNGSPVEYQVREAIAYVRLNAPPLNLLTGAMMEALAEAVARAQADRSLKGLALTANGKAFSAGADIGEHRPEQAPAMIRAFSRLFGGLGQLDLPIVMAVDGAALGAGFELVLMADLLLASERASFGQPEIRLGFFAPVAVACLPARIGLARAIELTSTGRSYSAAELQAMGMITRIVPPAELPAALEALLADLRRASAPVLRMNVRLARTLMGRPFEEARRYAERVFLDELMKVEDVREGIAAFYEKRQPVWRNQ